MRISEGLSKAEKDSGAPAKISWAMVMVEEMAAYAKGAGVTKNDVEKN